MAEVDELKALREELGEIDGKLLALIQERQQTALKIGAIKSSRGRATRDFVQEANVIRRAAKKAEAVGLDAKVAEELMVLLIRSSLTAQEQDRVASTPGGDGKKALLIGGAGKMGRWFARFLSSQGYKIEVADPAGEVKGYEHHKDWKSIELDHDIIVVATPLRVSAEVLKELAAKKPQGVVFDVGSLKSPLRAGLRELADAGVKVCSMHPMFGPNTELLSGRHVIFIDLGSEEANQLAKALFASTMATQVDMELENHDRLIAYVLGLSHALNLAFTSALAESGEAAPTLAMLSSTTFDAQLKIATSVSSENPRLYFEIQNLNDYGSEALSALLYAVEKIRSVVRAGDEEGFVKMMEQSSRYLEAREQDPVS